MIKDCYTLWEKCNKKLSKRVMVLEEYGYKRVGATSSSESADGTVWFKQAMILEE